MYIAKQRKIQRIPRD